RRGSCSSLATRSRRWASISAFWKPLARLVNGNDARLRARRMRVEMTMSDSGPVPRSHSPQPRVSCSRFIPAFPFSEEVPQPGGLLVPCFRDGGLQLPPQFAQLGRSVAGRMTARHLADVPRGAVNPLQQRFEAGPEDRVVVRTAEPPLGPELHVADAALRAGQ